MAWFESASLGKATTWFELLKSVNLEGEETIPEPNEPSSPSEGWTANLSLTIFAKALSPNKVTFPGTGG